MKNIICILLMHLFFLPMSTCLYAQNSSDSKYLFKMWLFLDHSNDHSREIPSATAKDSVIFKLFDENIELKFDTLKANSFLKEYLFLSVNPKGGIKYSPTTNKLIYLSIPSDSSTYVLCVNKFQGTSFRLKGFSGNDLFSLINEIIEKSKKEYKRKLSMRDVLKQLNVQDIDFDCIFRGLKDGNHDPIRYPCLQRCTNIEVVF